MNSSIISGSLAPSDAGTSFTSMSMAMQRIDKKTTKNASTMKRGNNRHVIGDVNAVSFMKLPKYMGSEYQQGQYFDDESDKEVEGILVGLQSMQKRIDQLEEEKSLGKNNLFRLRSATDTYTALLQRQRAENNGSGLKTSSIEVARNGSSATDPSSYSHLQRHTSSPIIDSKRDENSKKTTQSHKRQEFVSLNSTDHSDLEIGRPSSGGRSSVASVVRLSEEQRRNLNQYSERLKHELAIENEKGTKMLCQNNSDRTSVKKSVNPIEERAQIKLVPPPLSSVTNHKHRHTIVDNALRSDELQTVPSRERDDDEIYVRSADRIDEIDYGSLRERLAKLKDRYWEGRDEEIETNQLRVKPFEQKIQLEKRAHSQPNSPPISKIRKPELLSKEDPILWKPPPFVAAKATGDSHSLNVNLQQLLAFFKTQNPVLHQICLRLGPNAPVCKLADAFRIELGETIEKWEAQLDKELKLYDQLCHAEEVEQNEEKRRRLQEDRDNLAVKAERKDTMIQRLHGQLSKLELLISKQKPVAHRHKSRNRPVALLGGRHHIFDHTLSSMSKTTSPSPVKAKGRSHDGGECLRGIKSLRTILADQQ